MKRGSALILALWIIAVLSVMVVSFAYEARMQTGVNVYLREKNRVKRLVESGRILGETILLGYKDAKAWSEDENEKDMDEEDRWYREKRDLKGGEGSKGGECTIGPIMLDEEHPDSGTVTVKISMSNNETSGININELYQEKDQTRWQLILNQIGISENDGRTDFRTEDGESINLQSYVIACWMHYRGEAEQGPKLEGIESGISDKDYEDYYDDHKDEVAEEDRYKPAHGPIASLTELSRVLCFQRYPAILTGGVVNPWEGEDSQIRIPAGGLLGLGIFGVSGGTKLNANHCTVKQLMTVPGILDEDEIDEDDKSESVAAAQAIIDTLHIKPEDSDLEDGRDMYPYKDFADLVARVEDAFPDVEIQQEAAEYLQFEPGEDTVFKMTITGRSMGMKHEAECECYVKDKKVRYISWKEN